MRSTSLLALALAVGCAISVVPGVGRAAGGGGGGMGGPAPGGLGGRSGAELTELFREGLQQLADGECEEAEDSFARVLRTVSKNPEANYLRALALQCQGEFKSAIRYLRKAKRYDRALYAAYEKLGVSYLEIGEPDDAKDELEDLTDLLERCDGECPPELRQAHSDLEAAIRRREAGGGAPASSTDGTHGLLHGAPTPAIAQAVYLDAVGLINAGEVEQAIEVLRRLAARIAPHPDVANYLGFAHRKLGRFDVAQRYYEEALALDPMHRGANEYLGEMWVELGRLDEARRRLAVLDLACPFGCPELEDLERRIESRVAAGR